MKYAGRPTLGYLMIVTLLVAGCKETEKEILVPSGSGAFGSLYGFVNLINEDGTRRTNRSGVHVSIDGIPSVATTDSAGRWSIPNLLSRSYNINILYPGFGLVRLLSYQYVGGTDVYFGSYALYEKPHYYIAALSDTVNGSFVYIQGTLSDSGNYQRTVVVFMSADSTGPGYTNFLIGIITGIAPGQKDFSMYFVPEELHGWGFPSHSVAYLAAYTFVGLTSYPDTATGGRIYTSLSDISARGRLAVP